MGSEPSRGDSPADTPPVEGRPQPTDIGEAQPSISEFVDWLAKNESTVGGELAARRVKPGCTAETTDVPFHSKIQSAIAETDIDRVYQHQADAIEHARRRDHVTLATPTGSGKSFPYSVLAAERALETGARTLYIAPTRALINDQADDLYEFLQSIDPRLDAARYTGALSRGAKRRVRDRQPHILCTTPDMVHYSILPFAHQLWGWLLSNLDLIVLDEQHHYRGVFGSHVAVVLRRLRRLCDLFDADPTIVACSATIDNAREHTAQLTGVNPRQIAVVEEDTSASGPTHWLFWQPPQGQDGQPRSTHTTTARLAATLVERGLQTLVFTRSRQTAEQYAQVTARRLAHDGYGDLADVVTAYQAGLPDERRDEIEAGLHSGEIRAVWSTNALEVGVDIGSLDAVLVDGYPGTRMELFQQAGRAGRGTAPSVVGLVAGADPLDQYALAHPDDLLDGSVEAVKCNPHNPHVVTQQLPAAAAEAPLTPDDSTWFGDPLPETVASLTDEGTLDRRSSRTGVSWTYVLDGGPPPSQDVSLRSITSQSLRVCLDEHTQSSDDASTETEVEVLGELPFESGLRDAHPDAIYFQQGERYQVTGIDLRPDLPVGDVEATDPVAWVEPTDATHTTSPITDRSLTIDQTIDSRRLPGSVVPEVSADGGTPGAGTTTSSPAPVQLTELRVTEELVGYYTHQPGGATEGPIPLSANLPETTLSTDGVVLTIPPRVREVFTDRLSDAGDGEGRDESTVLAGSLQALANALLGVLPATVLCDRRDMRVLAVSRFPETGHPTIILYDDHPGGIGLAQRVFAQLEELLALVHARLAECECEAGCPACIHHPHETASNQTLDKAGARLLAGLLRGRDAPVPEVETATSEDSVTGSDGSPAHEGRSPADAAMASPPSSETDRAEPSSAPGDEAPAASHNTDIERLETELADAQARIEDAHERIEELEADLAERTARLRQVTDRNTRLKDALETNLEPRLGVLDPDALISLLDAETLAAIAEHIDGSPARDSTPDGATSEANSSSSSSGLLSQLISVINPSSNSGSTDDSPENAPRSAR